MGMLLVDKTTKGYVAIAALSAATAESSAERIDKGAISPALTKLLEALKDQDPGNGNPTEILIVVRGKNEHAFSIELDDLSEIQEILQWTVGRE